MTSSLPIKYLIKKNMALRGLKITWVCIAILLISCSIIYHLNFKIVHFCSFQNTFPFVSTFRETDVIRKKRRNNFVEQGIVDNICLIYGLVVSGSLHVITGW